MSLFFKEICTEISTVLYCKKISWLVITVLSGKGVEKTVHVHSGSRKHIRVLRPYTLFFFIRTFFKRTLRPRFTKILRTC